MQTDPNRFPIVDRTLLNALDASFPERSPRLGESMDELMFRAGQRSVVTFLQYQLSQHEDSVLTL